jgi:hypothetical protein
MTRRTTEICATEHADSLQTRLECSISSRKINLRNFLCVLTFHNISDMLLLTHSNRFSVSNESVTHAGFI